MRKWMLATTIRGPPNPPPDASSSMAPHQRTPARPTLGLWESQINRSPGRGRGQLPRPMAPAKPQSRRWPLFHSILFFWPTPGPQISARLFSPVLGQPPTIAIPLLPPQLGHAESQLSLTPFFLDPPRPLSSAGFLVPPTKAVPQPLPRRAPKIDAPSRRPTRHMAPLPRRIQHPEGQPWPLLTGHPPGRVHDGASPPPSACSRAFWGTCRFSSPSAWHRLRDIPSWPDSFASPPPEPDSINADSAPPRHAVSLTTALASYVLP